MKVVRAQFQRDGKTIRTRYYRTAEQAQDALAKRIGGFPYLGRVASDVFEKGKGCEYAPRKGGAVSLTWKEKITVFRWIEEDEDGDWWICAEGEERVGPFCEWRDASLWQSGMIEGDLQDKKTCKLMWEIDDE